MAPFAILWAVLLLAAVREGSGATFTITPTKLELSGNSSTGRVTMRCSPSGTVQQNGLLALQIKQTPYGSSVAHKDATELAFASIAGEGDGSPTVRPNSPLSNDVEVAGGISSGYLELIIPEATCGTRFEATYICVDVALKTPGSFVPDTEEQRLNFTVEVGTGTVDINADPLQSTYQVNSTLTLTCNGQIGNAETGLQISWVWQYRDAPTGSFPGGFPGSFVDYDRKEDIVDGSVNPDGACQHRQTSTLTRTLTPQDDGREYRCFVRRGTFPSDPIEGRVGTYTIQNVVTEPGDTGGSTGGNNNSETPSKANVGAIVGGVIAALVVIVVVVVLVYFLVIRKRRQKAEAYNGGNNKPADEVGPTYGGPYPTSNADVTYSQPNRFAKRGERGVTNKGMDDQKDERSPGYDNKPSYESKPARYENDRERNYRHGGRNPGYNYDDDRDSRPNRRYSSDDGGTDRDVNTSMGDGDPTMGTAI